MLWILAILLVAVSIGVLVLGLRRGMRSLTEDAASSDAGRAFFREQLAGIDRDVAGGRLSEAEAVAARAELAREVIRYEKENTASGPRPANRVAILVALPTVAVASLGLYAAIGRADLPAQPLSGRQVPETSAQISIEAAVAQIEARMVETPNDVRGWMALGPIYMEQERYGEAVNAFRRVLDLEPPTADRQTNLAEALILASAGAVPEEAMDLLRDAAASEPDHVRSRFYLAGELTRSGAFDEAVALWEDLLSIAVGTEAWVETARSGLTAAQAGRESETLGESEPDATMDVMIRGMVDGLAARLYDTGGTLDEWMQLVRSRLVLDGREAALADLDRALAAVEDDDRIALEMLARELGLNETTE